jgi:hypothetical protein
VLSSVLLSTRLILSHTLLSPALPCPVLLVLQDEVAVQHPLHILCNKVTTDDGKPGLRVRLRCDDMDLAADLVQDMARYSTVLFFAVLCCPFSSLSPYLSLLFLPLSISLILCLMDCIALKPILSQLAVFTQNHSAPSQCPNSSAH